jgi:DivIVA domain-containing protein
MFKAIDPDEIEKASFATGFRGYEPEEVHAYLHQIAEQVRSALKEAQESSYENLGEDIGRLLQNAKNTADEIVTKAQEKANQADADSQRNATRMRQEAEEVANQMRQKIQREKAQRVKEAEAEIARLSDTEKEARERIDTLRTELEDVMGRLASALGGTRSTDEQIDISQKKRQTVEEGSEVHSGTETDGVEFNEPQRQPAG